MRAGTIVAALLALAAPTARAEGALRAGAAEVDVTPREFPVRVNGMFLEGSASKAVDPLHAKALVLDDGRVSLAIVVVDSCMLPRELVDLAKGAAAAATGIPADRMLVSATHTHSAPAAMGALGCRVDEGYAESLPGKIAQAIAAALARLEPARVGWNAVDAPDHTHCRRWVRRPDRMLDDPFGDRTVRANMHPGHESPDAIAPSGPVDPGLSLLSVQAADGRPIALLANYSMHYVGSPALSSDYFGKFAESMRRRLGEGTPDRPFVAMMSQGTSGDQMWMDYGKPARPVPYDAYAEQLAEIAEAAHRAIEHRDDAPLAMAETRLRLGRRVPDANRLAWADAILERMGDRPPRDLPEVYAKEARFLHEEPSRELVLQAIRVGDLGITAIPNEVFAITGLKLKLQSPLPTTMNVELANGSEGYIPPPEQHALGGYTTWPARTAALEVGAEPRIVEALLGLLEAVAGRPRRPLPAPGGPYARAVLDAKPAAYWRLGEIEGASARGVGPDATFEPGFALFLEGPDLPGLSDGRTSNRAPHLAGGRLRAEVAAPADTYSIEFWFWNGLPDDARPVTGYLASRGPAGAPEAPGDHLGLGGTHAARGKLFFFNGNDRNAMIEGTTPIAPKTWHHVAFVRSGDEVAAYLDGRPEFRGKATSTLPAGSSEFFIGGRSDGFAPLEGKIDEVAVYDRALTAEEVANHVRASQPIDR